MNTNKNQIIIKEFEKLIEQIKLDILHTTSVEKLNNQYRLKQISNSLDIIKKYPNNINKGEDIAHIKGIGKGTINRINEILETGRLNEIKINKKYKKYLNAIEELEQIFGIGRNKAYELITKYNIDSIEKLKDAYKNKKITLSNQIILGLKYYGIYKKNIPRSEIDLINNFLKKEAYNIDKKLIITICGSYRRLKLTSNDIDVLISHPNIKTSKDLYSNINYLSLFIKNLINKKFIIDNLTDDDFEIKYMGYCKYKNYPIRRIDMRYIQYESYHASLLYFTGSGKFNRKMRLLAKQLGYMLNEYGIFKINNNKKIIIKTKTEKDIFNILEMDYLPPEKRN